MFVIANSKNAGRQWRPAFLLLFYSYIYTGVFSFAFSQSVLMSSSDKAMQPSVQSLEFPPPCIPMAQPSGGSHGGMVFVFSASAIAWKAASVMRPVSSPFLASFMFG